MKSMWSHISGLIPIPEIEEIERIIGKRLIDRNEILIIELNCLKDIVGEFLAHQLNRVEILNDLSAAPKILDKEKVDFSFYKMDSLDDKCYKNPSECSSQVLEVVETVKDYLTVSRIHDVADQIREALENEKDELDAEIQLLQSSMDVESDMISRASTPMSRGSGQGEITALSSGASLCNAICSVCGCRFDPLSSSADIMACSTGDVYCGPGRVRRISHQQTSATRAEKTTSGCRRELCSVCQTSRGVLADDIKSTAGGISLLPSAHLDWKEVESTDTSRQEHERKLDIREGEPKTTRRPGKSGGGRSRVRSRIESARDERFFLDEDPFLN